MREIKFRGKRVDNGEWVYGLPVNYCNKTYILILTDFEEERVYEQYPHKEMWPYEVIPETVGQFTGLHDKNGKEIYEGDIIRFTDGIKINGSTIHQSAVKWVVELSGFYIHADCVGYYQVNPSQCEMYHYEIIGNVHTNPELLKEVSHEA